MQPCDYNHDNRNWKEINGTILCTSDKIKMVQTIRNNEPDLQCYDGLCVVCTFYICNAYYKSCAALCFDLPKSEVNERHLSGACSKQLFSASLIWAIQ